MKLFIFNDIKTRNYHSGGGAVIVAESLDRAQELARLHGGDAEWENFKVVGAPVAEYSVRGPEGVWVFPDKGCC